MVQVFDREEQPNSSTTQQSQPQASQGEKPSAKSTKKSKAKGRFVQPSTSEDVDDLASARIATVTVRQTRWAVKIFRGKFYLFYLFYFGGGGGNCCNVSFIISQTFCNVFAMFLVFFSGLLGQPI